MNSYTASAARILLPQVAYFVIVHTPLHLIVMVPENTMLPVNAVMVYVPLLTLELVHPAFVVNALSVVVVEMLIAPEYVVDPASQVPAVVAAGLVPSVR
jgi:hypothetical protein